MVTAQSVPVCRCPEFQRFNTHVQLFVELSRCAQAAKLIHKQHLVFVEVVLKVITNVNPF